MMVILHPDKIVLRQLGHQVVGSINFQLDGKTIDQRPLVVMNEVKEGGFISRIIDYIKLAFHHWFG